MQPRYQQWIAGEAVPPKAGRYLDQIEYYFSDLAE